MEYSEYARSFVFPAEICGKLKCSCALSKGRARNGRILFFVSVN